MAQNTSSRRSEMAAYRADLQADAPAHARGLAHYKAACGYVTWSLRFGDRWILIESKSQLPQSGSWALAVPGGFGRTPASAHGRQPGVCGRVPRRVARWPLAGCPYIHRPKGGK